MKRFVASLLLLCCSSVFAGQTGIASWYGGNFHGKLTANGERYNMYGISCASKTLPLGKKVRVTNLKSRKSCLAVVNDRGPYVSGRILDMSKGLKDRIGCGDLCRVSIST